MQVCFLVISLLVLFDCSRLEDGWMGIMPLKTDRAAVEKILGRSQIDDNGYYGYETDEVFIRVDYSIAPCSKNSYGRGKYSLLSGTVLDYVVNVRKTLRLTDLSFQPSKYRRDASGHVINFVDYINSQDGITISVSVQENVEYVRRITFRPPEQELSKLACDK